MSLCRFTLQDHRSSSLGVVNRDTKIVTAIENETRSTDDALDASASWESLLDDASEDAYDLDDVSLHAPVTSPTNLFGVGEMESGNSVAVSAEGVGTLKNTVSAL